MNANLQQMRDLLRSARGRRVDDTPGWAARVVTAADAYEKGGMRRDRAFARALRACRDGGPVVLEDEPAEPPPEVRPTKAISPLCQQILDAMTDAGKPVGAVEISDAIGRLAMSVRESLAKMHKRGLVVHAGLRMSTITRPTILWRVA